MACATCGAVILFGGEKLNGRRYCNARCLEAGRVTQAAERVPDAWAAEAVEALHAGPCPNCNGPGPVDVHVAHSAWSALVMTSWSSKPQVCCQRCGRNAKLKAIAFTGVFGWWGFPWGLIATPVQIGRNVFELMTGPDPSAPSAKLEEVARLGVAHQALEQGEVARPKKVQFNRTARAAVDNDQGER